MDPAQAIPQTPDAAPTPDVRIEPPAQHAHGVPEPQSQTHVDAESAASESWPPRTLAGQRLREPIAALPANAGPASALDTKRVAWIVVGIGVVVSLVLSRVLGSAPLRLPELGDEHATAAPSVSGSAATEPSEHAPTETTSPTTSASPKQYAVDVGSEPSGARVSALGRFVVTPGRLNLGTLTETTTATAQLAGYRTVTAQLSPSEFSLDGDLYLRKLVVKLDPEAVVPGPAPAAATVESDAHVEIAPASVPKQAAAAKSVRAKPKPTAPKRAPAQAAALPGPATASNPAAAADPPDGKPQTPLQIASACLAQADNECVIRALEGNAKTARASEVLIETYRAVGNTTRAEQEMKRYIRDFPDEKRASEYQRKLGQHEEGAP